MGRDLLLKFREKDSPYGISREALKAMSKELDVAETMVVHLALAAFARDVLPTYEPDDGPLSKSDLDWVRKCAAKSPRGKLISKKSLL
jgi:hypothetical protein